MSIEILEPRIAPSGVVQIFSSPKSITIKDTVGDDSSLTISASPTGEITITPDGATVLDFDGTNLAAGQPITLPFFTGSLNAMLGGGADTLTVSGHFASGVKIDLGEGNNVLFLKGVSVAGPISVKGGTGADSLQFEEHNQFSNSFVANFGDGDNNTSALLGARLTVAKNFTIQAGKGFNALGVNVMDAEIGGNVSFSAKGVSNQFALSAVNRVTVGGSITMTSIASGPGESFFTLSAPDSVTVGGNVTMKTTDSAKVGGGIFTAGVLHIGGSVSINAGKIAGINPLTLVGEESLFIGKSVTITTSDQMRPEVRGGSVAGASYIGGAVTIKGSHTATIALDGTIAGKVNVAVAGDHVFPVALSSASADGILRLLSTVNISTFKAKAGTPLSTVVDNVFALSSLTIKDGEGARSIVVRDSYILGSLTIDTGAGIDDVKIEGHSDPGMTVLIGALTVKTGAGLDVITLGGNDPGTGLSTRGKILIDGGADLATYTVGSASLLQGVPVIKNTTP